MASSAIAVPTGYTKRTIPLDAPPVGLAFDAGGVLFALEGAPFGSNNATIRVIQPDHSFGADLQVVGDSSANFFVGGMAYDPIDDRLLITDNTADGRLYSVDMQGVQQTLAIGIPTIAGVAVRSTGEIFVSTALGNNLGRVLQVDRQTGSKTTVATGIDFGAGLAFDTNGNLLVQESDAANLLGRVHLLPIAETMSGLSFGSLTLLGSSMEPSAGLVVDSEGDIFSSGRGGLYSLLGTPLAEVSFDENGSANQFATALAFDAGSQPFEPHSGPDGGRLAMMGDFGFGAVETFVTVIEPAPIDDADFNNSLVVDGEDLALWEANFGTAGSAARSQGDANGDLDVDGHDFLVWQRQFDLAGSLSLPENIPEPASIVLGLIAFASMAFKTHAETRRRREIWD